MSTKQRLSASVDPEVLAAAQRAVSAGRASNISTWVNEALHRQVEHDQRMLALDEFLAQYEAEHGTITDDELRSASRRARARAVVIRGAQAASPARSAKQRQRAARRR